MIRHASHAGGDDTVPYDRELIRSGGLSSSDRRRPAVARRRRPSPDSWEPRPRQGGEGLRWIRRIVLATVMLAVVGAILLGVRAAAFNALSERFTFDKCHDEEDELAVLLNQMNGHDVWMRQARGSACLPHELAARVGVGGKMRREQLDGYATFERHVAREEHEAHSTAAKFPFNRESAGDGFLQGVELGTDVF